jgi:hypothetical protein
MSVYIGWPGLVTRDQLISLKGKRWCRHAYDEAKKFTAEAKACPEFAAFEAEWSGCESADDASSEGAAAPTSNSLPAGFTEIQRQRSTADQCLKT